eukprot:gb/GFBE01080802.1/.p3 GENE.gb/GFBE01080802.1/~~gb/GFBE01080802.1/.p3  ORF type:complete len:119 (+),score=7.95 gb/GFBE01080802.1/:36-392(+)
MSTEPPLKCFVCNAALGNVVFLYCYTCRCTCSSHSGLQSRTCVCVQCVAAHACPCPCCRRAPRSSDLILIPVAEDFLDAGTASDAEDTDLETAHDTSSGDPLSEPESEPLSNPGGSAG